MQIEVHNTSNNPPVTEPLQDFCVVAGDTINYLITSNDAEGDSIRHFATGGMFLSGTNPAQFTTLSSEPGHVVSRFYWVPGCEDVRGQPYMVNIKAEDNNSELSLVDISNFNIRVLGPPPQKLTVVPSNNVFRLSWSADSCSNVTKYRIYRKVGFYGFTPDTCQNGVPSFTGYISIGETTGPADTTFIDNGEGSGLLQGTDYCYMVVGLYSDGSESIASEEICGTLVQGFPLITNVSVLQTDLTDGKVFLAWAKPRNLDTIPALGPYQYKIYRSEGLWGTQYTLIDTIQTADLNDTIYTDSLLNTLDFAYSYKIELYNNEPGNVFLIGPAAEASTLYITLVPNDNQIAVHCRKNVPWINTEYVVYRQNDITLNFDSLGVSPDTVFIDTGLINGKSYCYLVRSSGSYNRPGVPSPLINFSQEVCGMPQDQTPPCPPSLVVHSICDSLYNFLEWTDPNNYCADDVVSYKIYFKNELNNDLVLLETINSATDTTYKHYQSGSLAACYAVTAVDSFDNESAKSIVSCVDSCSFFEVPNVFTPNGDNYNDVLKARVSPLIEKIDMKIYTRNGTLVYRTSDPQINWDGRREGKKQFVAPGVYYYMCDVFEKRLTGLEVRNVSGFIHVITEKGARIIE